MMYRRTLHGWLGLALLLGAMAGSLAGVGLIRRWFFVLAWWGYIMALDGLVQARQGNSLMVNRAGTFWLMAFVSASFWFGWEAVNLRIQNWQYVGAEPVLALRWAMGFLSFATVLPGIFLTYEALASIGFNFGKSVPAFNVEAWRTKIFVLGIILFAVPLLWPRTFFPLVWLGLIFFLEPLNHKAGVKSLFGQWEKGDLSPFFRLLAAGMICGLWWESWNFMSEPRWEYSLPYLNSPKVFAMPLAGYAGFPVFALECYVFFASISILRGGRGWERDDHDRLSFPGVSRKAGWMLASLTLAFDLVMMRLIDLHLVKSFAA